MHSNSVITLSNSIIGVSILAMPFCFQQCGIILSLIILFFISIISRLACHFLLKSAVISRCRSFEFLAFHMFGPAGKTVIELSIVGFLMGSCVAFFVVVGDLGPAIVKSVLNLEMSVQALRPALLIGVAVFIILPLGLVRDIDSLSSICTLSIGFYIILVLKIIAEATPPIFDSSWADKVNYWRPAGILQCLPIFSSALSCQTQLFEIFGSYLNGPLDKINGAIKSSVNMCTAVYMGVGLFGYIAFCSQPLTGNALMNFPPSLTGDIIKLGFVVSVALSFPLVIFPCRASLYSFLYHQNHSSHYELLTRNTGGSSQNVLTLLIVTVSLILALLVPSIELVLGLLGSTIGVILCYILPSVFFTRLLKKNTNERLLAQVVIIVGVFIMVLGTYTNLFAAEKAISGPEKDMQLNIAISPEKEFPSEIKHGLEEMREHSMEAFHNVPEKLHLDQANLDLKENADQVKVSDDKKNQVSLVDSNKDLDQSQGDAKKEPVKTKSENLMKATRKEPPEPVEPVETKHFDNPKKIEVDTNLRPDLPENMNQAKSEAVKKEIIVDQPKIVADESLRQEKPAEKQVESPNEINVPKKDKEKIYIPKGGKIFKKLHEIPPKNPPSKKDSVVNNVNLEGNLRPEIMDKLKDTPPLPIALQKNINVFNVSLIPEKTPENDDKVKNRELLDHQNKNEPHPRERRDVLTLAEEELSNGKGISVKGIHENEGSETVKLVTRSLGSVDTDVIENSEKVVLKLSEVGDKDLKMKNNGENETSDKSHSSLSASKADFILDVEEEYQSARKLSPDFGNQKSAKFTAKPEHNLGKLIDESTQNLDFSPDIQKSDQFAIKSDINFNNQKSGGSSVKSVVEPGSQKYDASTQKQI
ncbi:unnamed protein product [Bemisia tabaci]|uniref:Amino acid transporter transmembrane domain-containing protein n=1 Tax=Bemisia tabaci TaxID=7038 RepID=A0A9P0A0T4_BEMTA|nr:unnamed protein product [Bemisia tabaci]